MIKKKNLCNFRFRVVSKKKGIDDEVLPFDGPPRAMDVDTAVSTASVAASGSLQKASGPHLEPTAIGNATSKPFYPAGASVILPGLSTRTDLEGVIGQVIANTTAADERVAVRLPSGEQIRVKFHNVRTSIFGPKLG